MLTRCKLKQEQFCIVDIKDYRVSICIFVAQDNKITCLNTDERYYKYITVEKLDKICKDLLVSSHTFVTKHVAETEEIITI
jgi:hypothetical protein